MSAGRATTIVLHPDGVRIPADLPDLAAFRRWVHDDAFPERGRIDWIVGEVEVDMAAEEVNTHGTLKGAIARGLGLLVEETGRGVILIDRTRVSSPAADLSAEPDVVVLLTASLEAGRARLVPKAGGRPDRYVEVEGAVDLVVEVLSDSSVAKDTRRLPPRYHAAGVGELWLVDGRGEGEVELKLLVRAADGYAPAPADGEGFAASPLLGQAVRLVRLPAGAGLVRYRLEAR